MRSIYLLIVLNTFLCSCGYEDKDVLFINSDIIIADSSKALIYYHTGECSFCYGVLFDIYSSFPEIQVVSVTQIRDTSLINYQLEKISFKGVSIIDSTNLFYAKNLLLLQNANLFVIDNNNNILFSDVDYNLTTKKSIEEILYEN